LAITSSNDINAETAALSRRCLQSIQSVPAVPLMPASPPRTLFSNLHASTSKTCDAQKHNHLQPTPLPECRPSVNTTINAANKQPWSLFSPARLDETNTAISPTLPPQGEDLDNEFLDFYNEFQEFYNEFI